MSQARRLGIWMDHSSAHLIEFAVEAVETDTIASTFTHQEKKDGFSKGENTMHNKEQHQQADYYKRLGAAILQYEEVLLFGPTDAKLELLNVLKDDHHFDKITIEVKPADKMTEHQQNAFVREHFSNKIIKFPNS